MGKQYINVTNEQMKAIEEEYSETATSDLEYGGELVEPTLDTVMALKAIGKVLNIQFELDITAEEILQEARDNVPDQQV
jgi:hypothetical protein